MDKLVKILISPFAPSLEVVGDIVIKAHVPYSDSLITVQISPNIQEYIENADTDGVKIRQFSISTPTDQTSTLTFDFEENRKHVVKSEESEYTIELMSIGKEPIQGQDFRCFELRVTQG